MSSLTTSSTYVSQDNSQRGCFSCRALTGVNVTGFSFTALPLGNTYSLPAPLRKSCFHSEHCMITCDIYQARRERNNLGLCQNRGTPQTGRRPWFPFSTTPATLAKHTAHFECFKVSWRAVGKGKVGTPPQVDKNLHQLRWRKPDLHTGFQG